MSLLACHFLWSSLSVNHMDPPRVLPFFLEVTSDSDWSYLSVSSKPLWRGHWAEHLRGSTPVQISYCLRLTVLHLVRMIRVSRGWLMISVLFPKYIKLKEVYHFCLFPSVKLPRWERWLGWLRAPMFCSQHPHSVAHNPRNPTVLAFIGACTRVHKPTHRCTHVI